MADRLAGEVGDDDEGLFVGEESLEVLTTLSSRPGRVGEGFVGRCVGCEEFAFESDQSIKVTALRSTNGQHGSAP